MYITNSINRSNPRCFNNFTSKKGDSAQDKKPRYKHYEQMDDSVLTLKSIVDAHRDVENSPKMKLFKAMPAIGAVLLGGNIALAQPGKLSAKAAKGLVFLSLLKGFDFVAQKTAQNMNKKYQKEENKTNEASKIGMEFAGKFALGSAVLLGGVGILSSVLKGDSKISKFVKKESNQLANEINNSKAGQFFENKVNPFLKKHEKGFAAFGAVSPVATVLGCIGVNGLLSKSLSKDFKLKAEENYQKGKAIQKIAKAEYDKIDAEEI